MAYIAPRPEKINVGYLTLGNIKIILDQSRLLGCATDEDGHLRATKDVTLNTRDIESILA